MGDDAGIPDCRQAGKHEPRSSNFQFFYTSFDTSFDNDGRQL
jgi:hypothetical protein